MQQVIACTNCGAPNASGQQFCTRCGARLAKAAPPQAPWETHVTPKTTATYVQPEAQVKPQTVPQSFEMLRIAAPVFRIVGWVVMVGGVVVSIAMALLMAQGALDPLASLLGSVAGVLGLGAVAAAVPLMVIAAGITGSLLLGLGMLAFADLCTAVGDVEGRSRTRQPD